MVRFAKRATQPRSLPPCHLNLGGNASLLDHLRPYLDEGKNKSLVYGSIPCSCSKPLADPTRLKRTFCQATTTTTERVGVVVPWPALLTMSQ